MTAEVDVGCVVLLIISLAFLEKGELTVVLHLVLQDTALTKTVIVSALSAIL